MNLQKKRFLKLSAAVTVVFLAFIAVTLVMAAAPKVYAAEGVAAEGKIKAPLDPQAGGAFLSAAIVTSVSCVAAGIAVGMTGSAAIGAVAERPELMGRTILVVGLAEGIAIYGLIIAIMILGKV
ncbi:MAG: ATP synthase subunit C [Planctomycetota bacterium]|jgi:V/A-type H+-transporting ATPase subunit K